MVPVFARLTLGAATQIWTLPYVSAAIGMGRAEWKITPQERGTDVKLDIDYDFKNPFIGMLAAANHDTAVTKILNAFLEEGRRRYGGPVPLA